MRGMQSAPSFNNYQHAAVLVLPLNSAAVIPCKKHIMV